MRDCAVAVQDLISGRGSRETVLICCWNGSQKLGRSGGLCKLKWKCRKRCRRQRQEGPKGWERRACWSGKLSRAEKLSDSCIWWAGRGRTRGAWASSRSPAATHLHGPGLALGDAVTELSSLTETEAPKVMEARRWPLFFARVRWSIIPIMRGKAGTRAMGNRCSSPCRCLAELGIPRGQADGHHGGERGWVTRRPTATLPTHKGITFCLIPRYEPVCRAQTDGKRGQGSMVSATGGPRHTLARACGRALPVLPRSGLLSFTWGTDCSLGGRKCSSISVTAQYGLGVEIESWEPAVFSPGPPVGPGSREKPGSKCSPGPGLAHGISDRRGPERPTRWDDLARRCQPAASPVTAVLKSSQRTQLCRQLTNSNKRTFYRCVLAILNTP